jgi:hypothetical protein
MWHRRHPYRRLHTCTRVFAEMAFFLVRFFCFESLSTMARERACSTIPKVVAFASRSFISPSTVFSGLRPTQ